MEAKMKTQKPIPHDELVKKFTELYTQYTKATDYIKRLEESLKESENSFNKISFFISMLFKVMEHPEHYKPEFVQWAADNIMSALSEFSNAFGPEKEEEKQEEKKQEEEVKDEA